MLVKIHMVFKARMDLHEVQLNTDVLVQVIQLDVEF